jgi:phospholipid transport system substrate-binding protein
MNVMYRMLTIASIAIFALVAPIAEAAAKPIDVIESAVDLLNEGLDGRKDELEADEAALHEFIDGILLPRFDREFAAGAVLGKHWRKASDDQKDRFVSAFYTTLLKRYADGILEFDMERVEILPYKGDASKRTTVVKTNVRLAVAHVRCENRRRFLRGELPQGTRVRDSQHEPRVCHRATRAGSRRRALE